MNERNDDVVVDFSCSYSTSALPHFVLFYSFECVLTGVCVFVCVYVHLCKCVYVFSDCGYGLNAFIDRKVK